MKKRIIISSCLIVLLAVVIIMANTKKTEEQHGKSEFYKLMMEQKVDDYTFIEYARQELLNIDKFIEKYKEDELFVDYMMDQKDILSWEIEQKEAKNPKPPKNKKQKVEYNPLDYILYYEKYCCLKHFRPQKFEEFCKKFNIVVNQEK